MKTIEIPTIVTLMVIISMSTKRFENIDVSCDVHCHFVAYLETRCYIHKRGVYQQLQSNLMKHICECFDHNIDEI